MNIEILTITLPVVTFLLGVISAPIVESLKEKYKRKRDIEHLRAEIEDEIKNLSAAIPSMVRTLQMQISLKNGTLNQLNPIKFIPRQTSLLFLETVLSSSYKYLSSKKRTTLKIIKVQIEGIKINSESIMAREPSEENLEKNINDYKKYIFTACCLLYCMKYFLDDKILNFSGDLKNQEIIEKIFKDLDIDMEYNQLTIKKVRRFSGA